MNDRTINVSNNRPRAMVVPTCPMTLRGLNAKVAMVAANTSPAEVTLVLEVQVQVGQQITK
jgi:hypothetical protein